jgi:hypothetical protein
MRAIFGGLASLRSADGAGSVPILLSELSLRGTVK